MNNSICFASYAASNRRDPNVKLGKRSSDFARAPCRARGSRQRVKGRLNQRQHSHAAVCEALYRAKTECCAADAAAGTAERGAVSATDRTPSTLDFAGGQILSAVPARVQAPAGRAHLLLRSCLDQVRIGSRNCHAECVNFSGQQPSIESGPSSPFPFWLLPSIRRRRSRPIRSIDYRRGPAASERPGRAQRRLVVSIQGSSSRLYHEPMDRTN